MYMIYTKYILLKLFILKSMYYYYNIISILQNLCSAGKRYYSVINRCFTFIFFSMHDRIKCNCIWNVTVINIENIKLNWNTMWSPGFWETYCYNRCNMSTNQSIAPPTGPTQGHRVVSHRVGKGTYKRV